MFSTQRYHVPCALNKHANIFACGAIKNSSSTTGKIFHAHIFIVFLNVSLSDERMGISAAKYDFIYKRHEQTTESKSFDASFCDDPVFNSWMVNGDIPRAKYV